MPLHGRKTERSRAAGFPILAFFVQSQDILCTLSPGLNILCEGGMVGLFASGHLRLSVDTF